MSNLVEFLGGQSWMRVAQVLAGSTEPRSVRELAALSGMSAAGVHDVLRRLTSARVLQRARLGRKVVYSLSGSPEDLRLLKWVSAEREAAFLRSRAAVFSGRVPAAIGWIDETVVRLRAVRAGIPQ